LKKAAVEEEEGDSEEVEKPRKRASKKAEPKEKPAPKKRASKKKVNFE